MTDKELRRLRRSDLLEMLIESEKKKQELAAENQRLQDGLQERRIKIEETGSIAEAAVALNGVFETAQKAADQYLENIKQLKEEAEALREQTEKECQALKKQTEAECQALKEQTKEECRVLKNQTEKEKKDGEGTDE